ncbi:Acyl-CoA:lysophosphatidylglycerol acyltransferase 1 [Xenoophorus captivus]|uniref:Acyl-CoA:lysophosphatidylglycerol acyltransferase 1 n=1 Tax=Xenoophorus captivus TaxID=1517983 RepID=A0ABV0QVI0_9TELE
MALLQLYFMTLLSGKPSGTSCGKAHRDKQLVYLKEHLEKYYHSRDRKWIVLFPEGGFLRKRRETSQMFAKKNSLPHLTHVTLPRLGATHIILKTLSAQQENGSVGSNTGTRNQTGNGNIRIIYSNS